MLSNISPTVSYSGRTFTFYFIAFGSIFGIVKLGLRVLLGHRASLE